MYYACYLSLPKTLNTGQSWNLQLDRIKEFSDLADIKKKGIPKSL